MLDTRHVLADTQRVFEGITIGDFAFANKGALVHHGLATRMEATAPLKFTKRAIRQAPARGGASMRRRL